MPLLEKQKTGGIQYFKEELDKFRICEAESEKYIFQKTFLFISTFPLTFSQVTRANVLHVRMLAADSR